MPDWEKTRASPSFPACLDPRREKHSGSREEDRQLSFPLHLDFSSALIAPSDSPSGHGADHRLVSVPKVMVHGHQPKAGDGGDRPLCQFLLRDKHVRRYYVPPGSPIADFVRAGGVRFHMLQSLTVSDVGPRAEGRRTAHRRSPMPPICNLESSFATS